MKDNLKFWKNWKRRTKIAVGSLIPIIAVLSVWLQHTDAQDKLEKSKADKNEVASKLDSALLQIEVLSAKLTPFIEEASLQFPQINEDSALELWIAKTRAEIRKTLPQLKYIADKHSYGKVRETGDYYYRLVFEAVPSGDLRNQRIILKFNESILSAKVKIAGALALDQGKKLEINSDSTQISCFIDLLSGKNSLYIDITSKDSLVLESMSINP